MRVSTAEQADSGLSLEAQRAALERYAAAEGAELVVFEDPGCSGYKREQRPGLAAMLTAAKRGELSAAVVTDLDRLARNTRDALDLEEELSSLGVPLVELAYPVPLSDAVSRFTFTVRAAGAQMYRDVISDRTRRALAALKARGVQLGGSLPMGLRKNGSGKAVIDPERIATVRLVRELRDAGMGLEPIAERLNADGIPTARGGRWYASTVRYMLNNPRLAEAVNRRKDDAKETRRNDPRKDRK